MRTYIMKFLLLRWVLAFSIAFGCYSPYPYFENCSAYCFGTRLRWCYYIGYQRGPDCLIFDWPQNLPPFKVLEGQDLYYDYGLHHDYSHCFIASCSRANSTLS